MNTAKTMLLSEVKGKCKVKISKIKDDFLNLTLIKMGFGTGDVVQIKQKFLSGPVLLGKDSQDIAIGYDHLKNIEVTELYVPLQ